MLWIRTQNRRSLMNVKEATVKGKYIEGVTGRSFFTEWSKALGRYESRERAVEILGEIYLKLEEANNGPVTFTMPEN